ncbi:MAG: hypothetical protein OHK0029_36500 [Armatimonadaceae bacterium]
MQPLSAEVFASVLALVGIVIVLAALLSGFIERNNFPQVAVFLALGAVLGPSGLGLLDVTLDSPILRIVATLSLALVLFTDAVSLSIPEVRRHSGLAMLVLGPGTLSCAALVALGAWFLLKLPPAAAVILGAALASTDPVLLRGLLRRPDIPQAARLALRLESGLNDVILLPIVLVAMLFLPNAGGHGAEEGAFPWAKLLLDLFLLGPAAGVFVGLIGVATLDLVRRRFGVRRDYESLYSLGIAFAAFAAAEVVHGSGFLAAFMAGLTIATLDVELCDCFLEYGETTAEMALLFTFVLLGASLIWTGLTLLSVFSVAFALGTILARPTTFLASLAGTRLDRKSRFLIAWFGPRGLSSLLLVLLPVFAGAPDADRIFSYCCLVVVFSVTLHGGSLMVLSRWKDRKTSAAAATVAGLAGVPTDTATSEPENDDIPALPPHAEPLPVLNDGNDTEETAPQDDSGAPSVAGASGATAFSGNGFRATVADRERMTIDELKHLQTAGEQVLILDVRTQRTLEQSDATAAAAVRINPDFPVREAKERGLPYDTWLTAFCG